MNIEDAEAKQQRIHKKLIDILLLDLDIGDDDLAHCIMVDEGLPSL